MKAAHPLPAEDVMAYLDGEVNADEARDIQAHLASCLECQRLSADLRDGSMHLREWSVEDVPSTLVAPARRQPRSRREWVWFGPRVRAGLTWRPLVAGVAVVGVVIAAVYTTQVARKSPTRTIGLSPIGRVGGTLYEPAASAEKAESIVDAPAPATALLDRADPVQRGFAQGLQGQKRAGRPDAESAPTGPRIVRTARLRIVATEFSGIRSAIDRILQNSGGFVGSISASDRPGAARSIRGDLRIPSARFDAALGALRGLGRVIEDSQDAEDVTATVVDLDVRISNARATEKRLSDVLQNRTGRLSDVLDVEREIMRVRTEIEQMESQRKQLDGRVEYATVTLEVEEERAATVNLGPIPISTRLRQAIVDGLASAAMSVLDVTLLILRSGPVLLLWLAMLGLPVWWLLRRYTFRESRQPGV